MCFHAAAGSSPGLPGVTANEPYSMTAMTAMAPRGSNVEFLALDDFEELIRTAPSLFPKVFQVLAEEVRCAREALAGI